MKNIGHIRFIELLLLFFISTPIICLTDVEQLFKPFNNTSRGRTEVNSDEVVLNSSRNFSTSIRKNGISVRCKRYAQTYYKPYQRVGTYVYDPYGPYIVPPICIRCPTCCPRPCSYPYPSPAPIRTTYRPYRTHGTTSVPRITSSFGTTNKACNCDRDGSKFSMCNVTTGQCVCKPHFTGKICDTCENGFWKNQKNCEKCLCDKYGSIDENCDQTNGRCFCKPGVTGYLCNSCLPGYYGDPSSGCKKCDPCEKEGHICDPENGKCVCPPLTVGSRCENCTLNSWNYKSGRGCQDCNCSKHGSVNLQCDPKNGECNCKKGFQGVKCDNCSFGYYGYPDCKKCVCDPKGTEEGECSKDLCNCADDGSCKCKINVEGKNCGICKSGYFGLTEKKPFGCTSCFCYNRSSSCENEKLNWDKIRKDKFSPDSNSIEEIEDILMLPRHFLDDLTTSYGGYLTVAVPGESFEVYLEGNNIELYHFSKNTEVQITESSGWRIKSRNPHFPQECLRNLTRICFMTVLQNVTKIRINAKNRIQEVLLDRAKTNIPSYPATHSIEKCKCPKEYTGLSCQNPNKGFYRYYPDGDEYSWIDKVIGIAKPCECNGKSKQCDPDSGHCHNCSDHTSGIHCETCIQGYYKDKNNNCSPCLCPSRKQNHAVSCTQNKGTFKCLCEKGYKGVHCEECDKNFYWNETHCEPCNCNPFGTLAGTDCLNGICQCQHGFTGQKCDRCINEREFIQNGICTACDECTQILFNEIDQVSNIINATSVMFNNYSTSSWTLLEYNMKDYNKLRKKYQLAEEKVKGLLKKPNLFNLGDQIKEIQKLTREANAIAEENILKTDNLFDKSNDIIIKSKTMNKDLTNLINDIKGFGNANISLDQALTEAEKTQKEILIISDAINFLQDSKVLNMCSRIRERINAIYKHPQHIPSKKIQYLENMLEDIIDINAHIEADLEQSDFQIRNNSNRLKELKDKIHHLNDKHGRATNEVEYIVKKIQITNEILDQLEMVYENLIKISRNEELNGLENRLKRNTGTPEIEEMFLKSIEHVQELENKVKNYSSMFNFTKDEWRKINASGAYETIINGIKEVNLKVKLSQEIIENASKIITPDDYDDIIDKANLAYAYSDRLKKRINNFKSISKDLNLIKNKLNDLKYAILANGKSNNDLTQVLHKIETEITSQKDKVLALENAIQDSMDISNEMRKIEKEIENTQFDKKHIFFKVYQEFFNLTSPEEINNLSNTLRMARKKLQSLNISSTYLNSLKNMNQVGNENSLTLLRINLTSLHRKIDYARQAADMINVPLSLTNCSMSYKLSKREFFTSIVIKFKCQNCEIFNWKKNSGASFQIYIKKSSIKLIYDKNNHELKIDNKGSEMTIAVKRVGSIMTILVEGVEVKSFKISSDFSIMDLDDSLSVGSFSDSTTGYVYQIFLNEKNFGLWNFRNTSGNCQGQKRDKSDNPAAYLYPFFGEGAYRTYGINKQFVPRKLSLSFDIKTFDEDSLIYLAITEQCQQYVILQLEGGYATFMVSHGKDIVNTQKSLKKVNNGESYEIEITMNYKEKNPKEEGEQQYNLIIRYKEKAIETKSNKIALNSSELVKIRRAVHYLGGVPPTFDRSCLSLTKNSFLGFLKPKTPLTNEKSSYGISFLPEKVWQYYRAWINENGSIILNTDITVIRTLNFIVKPSESNGVIMKFTETDKLFIENGKLLLTNTESIDDIILNLNDYNEIEINFDKNIYVNKKKMKRLDANEINVKGQIQIGDYDNKGFVGGIQQIIINDQLLAFNSTSLKHFSNVDIGRDKERNIFNGNHNVKSLTLNPNFTNYMQNTEGCAVFENHKTENEAVKFGDKKNSYIRMKTNFWKTDYILKLEFRTLYPNGLIFFSSGHKQQSFIILQLKEGKIYLMVKGKRKDVPVLFNRKINDGEWHKIELNKKKRKLIITLDAITKKSVRIPKANVRNEIYIGGVPDEAEFSKFKYLKEKLLPFHGCMRSLIINEDSKFSEEKRQDKDILFFNTKECFSNVEEGIYFAGDGYAFYDENYLVDDVLEVSFEFRTAEQNGIILVLVDPRNSPSFSVELQNGALVMAVDTGNGAIRYASNNLDSDFALCNNQWHNVTALYSTSELTVIVNGIRKTWVQPDSNSMLDEYDAALYIGGIPTNAPTGTLRTRENFNGCIRKLKIGNIAMDWSEMSELHNVSINSCPTHSINKI